MNKRIFIALPVSTELHPRISEFQKKYSNLPIRWITPKNLHITLIPPWHEANVSAVIQRLNSLKHSPASIHSTNEHNDHSNISCYSNEFQTSLSFQKIEISLHNISFGPHPKNPRLIWASGETPRELIQLKQSFENLLGQKPEHRHFQTHITLARFRSEDFYRFPVKKLDESVNWKFRADSFVLMGSHLSPQGAEYEILSQMHL